ncbi:MAG: HAD-IIIA family hydrolase [Candidatus Omnitrophota bacterium]
MKIIFLDRDGVINKFPGLGKYVTKVKDFHFIPGALKAIKDLTDAGYMIFIVSNQAGVARGVYTKAKLDQITAHMLKEIKKTGGRIKKIFYCTHTSEQNCDCRKPKIGSIKRAFGMINKDIRSADKSFFVGDAHFDMQAGRNAGLKTILVLSGIDHRREMKKLGVKPDYTVKNLLEATRIILNENTCHSCCCGSRAH